MQPSETGEIPLNDRELVGTEPVTDFDCKTVMIRAERHDNLKIEDVISRFSSEPSIPENLTVVQRNDTYFGPDLELSDETHHYRLTAPGPDTFLFLWKEITDQDGFRERWERVAEVKVEFAHQQPQYDICSDCGEPIKTIEHERLSVLGRCPGVTSANAD